MTTESTQITALAEISGQAPETEAAAVPPRVPGRIGQAPSTTQRPPKPGSKTFQLIRLLSGKTGADVELVGRKLGWQAHTTRAAITGLRKAGYAVSHDKGTNGKPGRYRITAAPYAEEAR